MNRRYLTAYKSLSRALAALSAIDPPPNHHNPDVMETAFGHCRKAIASLDADVWLDDREREWVRQIQSTMDATSASAGNRMTGEKFNEFERAVRGLVGSLHPRLGEGV